MLIHRIRLMQGDEIALGPGKADLLKAIHEHGSISAAARRMGMSYRRAWLLVDTMNRCFREPLVLSAAGGSQGGGASLTPHGEEVLSHYENMQAEVSRITDSYEARLSSWLRDVAPEPIGLE
ncbi:MAG: LysR family transcriptional regulator [Pseudomonadota bacterium]